jgi:hypothetical protein
MVEQLDSVKERNDVNPGEILARWEANGIEDCLGLVGTSVWRLESIIRNGILSIQAINRGNIPERYLENLTFMAPLPQSSGHKACLDKYEAYCQAESYAKINTEQDAFENILRAKGFNGEQAYDFIAEYFEPSILTHCALAKRSLRRIARSIRKKADITNQEFYYFNRNVRMMTGVVLGIDPLVQTTHLVVGGMDDPRYEATIILGSRDDLPVSFIKGVYIPPLVSDFERAEIDRIHGLCA